MPLPQEKSSTASEVYVNLGTQIPPPLITPRFRSAPPSPDNPRFDNAHGFHLYTGYGSSTSTEFQNLNPGNPHDP